MDQAKPGFWERYRREREKQRQAYNSPGQRLEQRMNVRIIAAYLLLGLPLCLLLMKIEFLMGWPVAVVTPIAISIAYLVAAAAGYYLNKPIEG
jgi:hypothetical protein